MKKFLYILPVMALMFVANNVFAAPYTADDFVITVQTDNPGESIDSEFKIPTYPGETYNYDIDCNYNGVDFAPDASGLTAGTTCGYGVGNEGIYTIVIHGTFPHIYFNNGGDKQKILTIEQWGTGAWSSMENAFHGCYNLKLNAQDTPNLSLATSMYEMFHNAHHISEGTGNWNWDTSHITNMDSLFLFNSHSNFNADITSWDTSNVTTMNNMFYNTSFDRDISSWNVGNVENFAGMFLRTPFNQDISNWDTSNATNMSWMFYKDANFNQDISNWDVADVTDMSYMFGDATFFDQNIGNWNVSNVRHMEDMFTGGGLSIQNYDKLLIGWNALPTLYDNVQIDTGMSIWCSAAADSARNNIISSHNWTFNDDIRGNGCPSPTISEKTSVPTSTTDTTPNYTFNTDEAGEIIYGGSCSSATTDAVVGDNTITLNELSPGTYSDCTIKVRDDAGNDSNILNISTFTINSSTPIYRLYNTKTGAQLYTRGEEDKNKILNKYKDFEFTDGVPAFWASITDNGTTPIYRLYNKKNGAQLYTRGEDDKNKILNKYKDFEFTDGAPAFYASLVPQSGLTPIYRLYNTRTGMQLYTRGEVDKHKILSKYSNYEFTDGVPAFYAKLTQ